LRQRRARRHPRLGALRPAGLHPGGVRRVLPLVLAARRPDPGDEGLAHPRGANFAAESAGEVFPGAALRADRYLAPVGALRPRAAVPARPPRWDATGPGLA